MKSILGGLRDCVESSTGEEPGTPETIPLSDGSTISAAEVGEATSNASDLVSEYEQYLEACYHGDGGEYEYCE